MIKFCKIFCCLRLLITPGYWAIDKLVFSIGPYLASPARAKWYQDIDKLYFIKMTIEHFICSSWKPAWFEKLYQLSIAIGSADLQVASTIRLDVFCSCCCSLTSKNVFVCLFSVHKTYKNFWLALVRLLESVLFVVS